MKSFTQILGTLALLSFTLALQGCFLFVTDDDDDDDEPPFTNFSYLVRDPQYFAGQPIAANRLDMTLFSVPTNSVLSISPVLPAGLSFDSSNGEITGTPTTPTASTDYEVNVTTNSVQTGRATLTITVVDAVAPSNLTYSRNPAIYASNEGSADNVPSFTGVISSFGVSPALPTGLRMNMSTGVISGTPRVEQPSSVHTVTGTNPFGSTSVDLSISVSPRLDAARVLIGDSSEPLLLTYLGDSFPGNVYQRGYETLGSQVVDLASNALGDLVLALLANGDILSFGTQAGSVRLLGGVLQASLAGASHLELDASGTRLLVLTGNSLVSFDVDGSGNLSGQQAISVPVGAVDLVLHPSQAFAYVSNTLAGSVGVYSFSGALQALPGSASVPGSADDLSLPGAIPYLFVAELNAGTIHTLRIETAGTTAATHLVSVGAPVAVPGGQIEDLSSSPRGDLVFASTGFNQSIEAFGFDIELERLTLAHSTSFGGYLTEVRVDQGSRLLYALDPVNRELWIHRIRSNSLDFTDRSRTRQSPNSLELVRGTPTFSVTDHVFVSNETQNTIDTFAFDRSAQTLTTGIQVSGVQAPQAVVFNGTHGVAYVPERSASSIRMYSLDRANTTLVPLIPPSVPGGEVPTHLALGVDERFAYGVDAIGSLIVYAIDASTGVLMPTGAQVPVALNAGPLALDPTGQFLYLLEPSGSQIASFTLDLSTGVPTPIERVTTLSNPTDLVMFPQGREVFVTGSGSVDAMAISALDGRLSVHGTSAIVGMQASAMDIMSQGFNMYVGSAVDASISILNVDFATGEPAALASPFSPVSTGPGFTDLRVAAGDIHVFASFDSPTQQLSLFRSQPTETILEVDSAPLSSGVHHIGLNAVGQ